MNIDVPARDFMTMGEKDGCNERLVRPRSEGPWNNMTILDAFRIGA